VLYRLATTHRWIASPLVGLPRLTEFFDRRRCHAYWVSVNPLCRCLSRCEPHALAVGYRRETRLWGVRAAAYTTVRPVVNPLSGLGSLSESHPYITVIQFVIGKDRAGPHLPRFLPLQRFSATRSHLTPPGPIPSVRCVLRVSHPRDALLPSWPPGLIPSRFRSWGSTLRGFAPRLMPYVLSDAKPLRVFPPLLREEAALPGTDASSEAPPQARVSAGWLQRMPPWAFPLRGLLSLAVKDAQHALSSPLALFRLGRKLTRPPAPQGFLCQRRSRSLSRSASLLAVSHLVCFSLPKR
jgi:hypothetical protein